MNAAPIRISIVAGGTGGHVFPALAVAERLRAMGHQVTWIGTRDGLEAKLVPPTGIAMEWIVMHGLRGKGLGRILSAPLRILRATWQALAALRRCRAQVVLGMGGFVAGPAGLAAWLSRRPLLIHEQNAAAGMTNKALNYLAQVSLQAFDGALPGAQTVGNPVREAFAAVAPPAERFAGRARMRLLVLGGSLGAQALNERIAPALASLPAAQRPLVRHQGGRTVELAVAAYREAAVEAEVQAFIEDMPEAYGWADLIVCRAGAMTVAELAAAGCAALLVPFPHAVDDHQTSNAEHLVRAGAADLIQERDLDVARLSDYLRQRLADRGQLLQMAEAARAVAQPRALELIVDQCLAQVSAA